MDTLMVYFSAPSAALEKFMGTNRGPAWNQIQIPNDANYGPYPDAPNDYDSTQPLGSPIWPDK